MEIGGYTIFAPGDGSMAYCKVADDVILAGELDTLRIVLQRDRPARLPTKQNSSWQLTRSQRQLVVSFLPLDGIGWCQSPILPFGGEALKSVEVIGLDVTFEDDLKLQVSALCGDEKRAAKLARVVTGLCALAEIQNGESPQPGFQKLIESLDCTADGLMVTAKMTVPSGLVQIGSICSTPGLAGTATPPGATPVISGATPTPPGDAVCTLHPPYTSQNPTPFPAYQVAGGNASNPPSYPAISRCGPGPACNTPSAYAPSVALVPANLPPTVPPIYDGTPAEFSASNPYLQASAKPTLKISDVLRLVEAGVADQVIIRFARQRQLDTDLTVDDLILLTERDVTTEVISMLQELTVAVKPQPANATPTQTPTPTPTSTTKVKR